MKKLLHFLSLAIVFGSCLNNNRSPHQNLKEKQVKFVCGDTIPSFDAKKVSIIDDKTGKPIKDTIVDLIKKKRDVYKNCRKFFYKAEIISDEKQLLNGEICIHALGKRWQADPYKQDEIADSFVKGKNEDITDSYIKPIMMDELKGIGYTGVIENVEQIWSHPYRNGPFYKTEQCPFPEVRLPLKIGNDWSSTLSVLGGFHELSNSTINSEYKVTEKKVIDLVFEKNIEVWQIESNSLTSKNKKCVHNFLFSEKYGFVTSNYIIDDNLKINMVMDKVVD